MRMIDWLQNIEQLLLHGKSRRRDPMREAERAASRFPEILVIERPDITGYTSKKCWTSALAPLVITIGTVTIIILVALYFYNREIQPLIDASAERRNAASVTVVTSPQQDLPRPSVML